jgi:hypothetical protein
MEGGNLCTQDNGHLASSVFRLYFYQLPAEVQAEKVEGVSRLPGKIAKQPCFPGAGGPNDEKK